MSTRASPSAATTATTALLVAAAGNRFVVALGRRALAEAIAAGGSRLGDADAFRAAAAKLGGDVKPSFFLDVQKLGRIAASKRGGGDHARELREYLGAFGGRDGRRASRW